MAFTESGHLFIKDHEKPAMSILPFKNLIVDHKYLINESKIFYLTDYPVPKSMMKKVILNMEDLSDCQDVHEDSKYVSASPRKTMTSASKSFLNSTKD